MAIGSTSSSTDRNYTDMLNGTSSSSSTTFNAVFSNEDNTSLDVQDFFDLMVAQLTNQDFTNPVDDTQYLAQLAQFSSLTAMQELSSYSKTNYIMSLLGKDVTAAKYNIGGDVEKTTGKVTSISLVDNDYTLTVGGKTFTMDQVMTINDNTTSTDTDTDNKTDTEADNSDK